MRKLFLLLLFILCITTLNAQNQQKTITGSVLDTEGVEMIGVSVLVEGTVIGVITNFEGQYSITLPDDAEVLSFSYIGYVTQNVTIGNNTVIDVTMEADLLGLEEVVVIGYGSVKKSDLTGSVGSVAAERLTQRGSTAAAEALQGQIAGVNISRSSGRSVLLSHKYDF